VAEKKSKIFLGMPEGGVAIINRDMEEWRRVQEAALERRLTVILYGAHPDAQVRLMSYNAQSHEVTVQLDGKLLVYRMKANGRHMAMNSLAVLAAAHAMGLRLASVISAIGEFTPLEGRGETFTI